MRIAIFSLSMFIYSSSLFAEEVTQKVPGLTPVGMSTENMLKLFFMLFLVLGLIVSVAYLLKRFTNISEKSTGPISVIAQAPMGVKERVILLQVGTEQVLIGQSVAGLQTLHVLNSPIEELCKSKVKPLDFSATLKSVINK